MIYNYLTTAFRSLVRQKHYTFINLIGLSVGIASFVLIALYVQHELSFDKHLKNVDRLFRVVELQNEPGVGEQHVAITMGPLAESLLADFPQVTGVVRFIPGFDIPIVRFGEKNFREKDMYYTDPSVIRLFEIELVSGNPETVLSNPRSVLMSEKAAARYFGSPANAPGKVLIMGNRGFRVSGVMKDQPQNTHFFFDILVSSSTLDGLEDFSWLKDWGSNSLVTYVQLDKPESQAPVEAGFADFLEKHIFSTGNGWHNFEMYLQPVKDVYLKSQHVKFQNVTSAGDGNLVLIFIVIAILILIIACVNFINISIARSVKRAREVGIRKVLGADRMSLIYQFISESFIITLLSLILAIGLVELSLPVLNELLGASFYIDFIGNPIFNVGLLAILVLISLASGAYPAFYLSHYQPARVLKGSVNMKGSGAGFLSKGLVIFQFIISAGLIFSILVLNAQVRFMKSKKLGISYENVIYVPFGEKESVSKLSIIKDELSKNPLIQTVAGCSYINGVSGSQGPVIVGDSADTRLTVRFGFVDDLFFPAMGIDIVDGRNFSHLIQSDIGSAVILNEAAVRKLGWSNPIGKTFKYVNGADTTQRPKVVGVLRDYHYYSLRSLIEPAAYVFAPDLFRGVVIKYFRASDQENVLDFVEQKWKSVMPAEPFQPLLSSKLIEGRFKNENTVFSLFLYFTFISVILSCLGLFGLTSLMIEQKTRIIGIKRVLGGQAWDIALRLVREYLILVSIAVAIAMPLSYYLLQEQLSKFAYRIEIGFVQMLLTLLIIVAFSFLTIVFKALKAARANPVESLKYE
ncbi:MAG: ABC transporter permease [Lentimicrobiaceae bacterium]|nr:ABC transporter permease [Lentimicrobiaceae bacterium]